jgi:probable F420-dependent oxidoreductase
VARLRFGSGSWETHRQSLLDAAQSCEALGYDLFCMPDHLFDQLAPIPMLTAVASATHTIRLATTVICNDFRHPAVLAKEAATLDLLSDGRLELGLGAGYIPIEYGMVGIPFYPGAVRVARLSEAVQVVKKCFAGDTFDFKGEYYCIDGYTPRPKPHQSPPPLMLGGGGRQLLGLAAKEADIVSLLPAAGPAGMMRASHLKMDALVAKVNYVNGVAGSRHEQLDLNTLFFDVVFTNNRRTAAADFLAQLQARLPGFFMDGEVTVEDLLTSPYLAFGTETEIAEHVLRLQEQAGITNITIFPHAMQSFAAVIAKLPTKS